MKYILAIAAALWLGLFAWAALGEDYTTGDDVLVAFFCSEAGARALFELDDRDRANEAAATTLRRGMCIYVPQPIPGKLVEKLGGPKLVTGTEGDLMLELWAVDFGGYRSWAIFEVPGKGV